MRIVRYKCFFIWLYPTTVLHPVRGIEKSPIIGDSYSGTPSWRMLELLSHENKGFIEILSLNRVDLVCL